MDINFKSMVFPTKLMFKQRDLAANMVQTFTIFYDDDNFEDVNAKNIVGVQEIQLKAQVPTFRIRILIKAVYALGSNGGSFNVIGVSCNNPELLLKNKSSPKSSLEELFGKTPPPPI